MTTWTVPLRDQEATEALAADLAGLAAAGDVIALNGTLGAGKSAFARAFVRSRVGDTDVPSPTFNLVLTYDDGQGAPIWHFDLYRLEDPDEVYELGFEEALVDAISLIEWPERLGDLLPTESLSLTLVITGEESREAVIEAPPRWTARLQALAARGQWLRQE